jgi:hypothetical protein
LRSPHLTVPFCGMVQKRVVIGVTLCTFATVAMPAAASQSSLRSAAPPYVRPASCVAIIRLSRNFGSANPADASDSCPRSLNIGAL